MSEMTERDRVRDLRCIRCGTAYPVAELPAGCPACAEQGRPSSVAPVFDLAALDGEALVSRWSQSRPEVWRHAELLPVLAEPLVSLREGGTPLLPVQRLRDAFGLGDLLVKDERRNPTGSFKDRFFSVCTSRAREVGAETVVIASSGNGGASAAAYAAAAGLRCVVVVTPNISPAWRTAIATTGATLVATETTAERWPMVEIGVEHLGWYPLTNYVYPPVGSNWYGVEGLKTGAYEIAESLGWQSPDWLTVPVARGDNLWALWRGFRELYELGIVSSLPKMAAVERFPTLATALERGLDHPAEVETGPNIATSIGGGMGTYQALHTVRESGGTAIDCSDDELLAMVQSAGREGLFLEASAAAGLVGARKLASGGLAGPGSTVVAIATASGLTDPAPLIAGERPLEPVALNPEALQRAVTV